MPSAIVVLNAKLYFIKMIKSITDAAYIQIQT